MPVAVGLFNDVIIKNAFIVIRINVKFINISVTNVCSFTSKTLRFIRQSLQRIMARNARKLVTHLYEI
jgi:hypothetical protein